MDGFDIYRLKDYDWLKAQVSTRLFWDKHTNQEILQKFLSDAHNIYLSAELEGEPVGQCIGYILERWDVAHPMLFLYSIDVSEAFRRKGIGRKLLNQFLRVGREAGCSKTFVFTSESNLHAMQFYAAEGGTRPNPDDVMFEFG